MLKDKIKNSFYGIAIGDALGVPIEFISRKELSKDKLTTMFGFGTHDQPIGTFSDDTSLTFCLAESLVNGYDLDDIGQKMVNWKYDGLWTANGNVFDIGITTSKSIDRIFKKIKPYGEFDEGSNGNGSLMRIIPLLFYIKDLPIEERYQTIKDVSSITHAHIISVISCFIYLEYCLELLNGNNKFNAYLETKSKVLEYLNILNINTDILQKFNRILIDDIHNLPIDQIYSSGYVLHTLEASLWCILNNNSFKSTLLTAVNLGDDTDTTGAVTGGIAGLIYYYNNIPSTWLKHLKKKTEIDDLIERFSKKIN